jgi:hypothetical protein
MRESKEYPRKRCEILLFVVACVKYGKEADRGGREVRTRRRLERRGVCLLFQPSSKLATQQNINVFSED